MSEVFGFEIKEHIGTIADNNGYTKEINKVSWMGKETVIDFRTWRNDEFGKKPLKGMTLSESEFKALMVILAGEMAKLSE